MRASAFRGVRRALAVLTAVSAFALPGCGERKVQAPRDSAHATAARAQAMIDAGNRAYEAGEYGVAAKRYAGAAVSRPDDPAAFFGLGMALAKLGRDEEARAAYAKARELTRAQQP